MPSGIRLYEGMSLGEIIQDRRKAMGLTQTQMAKRLGIARQQLCDIEKGRRSIPLKKASAWAEHYMLEKREIVRLALQALLDFHGLPYCVELSTGRSTSEGT